jgi:predicted nucleotidyltransferase
MGEEIIESHIDEDMKALVEKAVRVLKAAGAETVHLFGSAARGGLREGSDVDLAVSGLPPEVFFRAMSRAGDALGCPLDLVDLDEDTPFTRYLKEEGELLRVG